MAGHMGNKNCTKIAVKVRVIIFLSLLFLSVRSFFQQKNGTMESRYIEGPGDWPNMFAVMRFCCIEVLFHTFYYYWSKEYCLLVYTTRS